MNAYNLAIALSVMGHLECEEMGENTSMSVKEWKEAAKGKNPFEFPRPFIVCPKCGNKRCPHANDRANECTNSNAIGQKGSAYE